MQSLLKFCSGYSIEDQNLTHDHILKNQKSLTVQKGKEWADQQIPAQDRTLQNLSSSQSMAGQGTDLNNIGVQLSINN